MQLLFCLDTKTSHRLPWPGWGSIIIITIIMMFLCERFNIGHHRHQHRNLILIGHSMLLVQNTRGPKPNQ